MKPTRLLFFLLTMIAVSSMILLNCKSRSNGATRNNESGTEPTVINQLTKAEAEEGWILLFDGKTTDGWRGYNLEKMPESGWTIEEGTLKCQHSGTGEAGAGGDILYDKKFKNFHLKLEWMIERGGNSGIFYLGQELENFPKIYYTAPEMQILDNDSDHPDNILGKDGNRRAGALYDLISPAPQNAKGGMEWNSVEIIVYEGTVVHFMNGEKVIEYHLWTDNWNSMVAGSKFPELNPDWANVAKEGYISLQDHGHNTWFRNIKLKEL